MIPFYIVTILFLISCNSTSNKQPKTKPESQEVIDTVFHKYFPDTTKFPDAVYWDNRYYLRTKAISPLLGLSNIEKGTHGLELRLWHLSSWSEAQEVYILKKSADSVHVYHFNFTVRLSSWDKPYWRKPDVKISKVSKSALSPVSYDEMKSINIDQLWNYPSSAEAGTNNNGTENCGAICIELADRNRYKFVFFPCPQKNILKAAVLDSIAELYRKLQDLK